MTLFYAFNGDADGLCALQALRLVDPRDATLVTGIKRDIRLLQRVEAVAGDEVTALDISLDQNRGDLPRLLEAGASMRCFDHHHAGALLRHPDFERQMLPFVDPMDFVRQSANCARRAARYAEDMEKARALRPVREVPGATVVVHPDEAWARRAIGVLASDLTRAQPGCAIAILAPRAQGDFTVSVRVPAQSAVAADTFCRDFENGSRRKRAGGINHLPAAEFDRFAALFEASFRTG
jgi:hypothetical protein